MDGMYSLKCSYLGSLQVTRGLSPEDLAHPDIFKVCSGWVGMTDSVGHFLKFNSGQFISHFYSNRLSCHPLEWPEGEALEKGIGPWKHQGDRLSRLMEYHRGRSLYEVVTPEDRPWLESFFACDELLNMAQMKSLTAVRQGLREPWYADLNGPATFDPEGVNQERLEILDSCDWAISAEGSAEVALTLPGVEAQFHALAPEDTLRARWTWKGEREGTRRAELLFNPDSLVSGCLLSQQGLCWQNRITRFDTIPEALLALALSEGLEPDSLMGEATGEDGDGLSMPQSLHHFCDVTTILHYPRGRRIGSDRSYPDGASDGVFLYSQEAAGRDQVAAR